MEVQKFLRAQGTLDDLSAKFAIKAARHSIYSNLVLLKYSQIDSPMGERVVQECRGLILDEAENWNVVARPYDKFFNHDEGHAAKIDWSSARVYEKLDGSLMTLYWYDDGWRVASSGSPDAGGVVHKETGLRFDLLFWDTWNLLGYSPPPLCLKEFCFMFELMTPFNRVIVPHSSPRLVLHGIRFCREPYNELSPDDISTRTNIEGDQLFYADPGWEIVRSHPLNCVADCLLAANALNPMDQEGFIVCDSLFNRVKVKSPQYVALHHMKDGLSNRRMLEIVRTNENAEFLSYFPEYTELFGLIKSKYEALVEETEDVYISISGIAEQKAFAIIAQKHRFSSALFALRNKKVGSVRDHFASIGIQSLERLI